MAGTELLEFGLWTHFPEGSKCHYQLSQIYMASSTYASICSTLRCRDGARLDKLHGQPLGRKTRGNIRTDGKRPRDRRTLFHFRVVAAQIRIGQPVELGACHPKPDPVDIGIDNRPTVSVPPAALREPPVDDGKIGTHGDLRHLKDPTRALRRVAEELRYA